MIESISETIGKYELSVIPRSLFSSDGLLLIPQNKSAFMRAIVEYKKEIQTDLGAHRNDDKCVDDVTEKKEMCVLSMLWQLCSVLKRVL